MANSGVRVAVLAAAGAAVAVAGWWMLRGDGGPSESDEPKADASEPAAAVAPGAPPNFLVISIDTLRRDHLSAYGYSRPTSPWIDSIAASGSRFDRMMATAPWTLPSHASIFTGRYPSRHELEDDGVVLQKEVPTVAELLARAGYDTLGVVSHIYVSSHYNLDRGFRRFDDSMLDGGRDNPIAGPVIDRTIELVNDGLEPPYFLFVHLFDPHWPYTPPAPFDERFTDPGYTGAVDGTPGSLEPYFPRQIGMPAADHAHMLALYDGEIAYADRELSRLHAHLRSRGLAENTVVIITADHGEEFKEHGRIGHGRTLYEEQLAVPLIVAGAPAFSGGKVRDDLVSSVDIAPTVLDLAGLKPSAGMDGQSLVDRAPAKRLGVAETRRFGYELRAGRIGDHKVIERVTSLERAFFDLARDPGEYQPLARDPSGGALPDRLNQHIRGGDIGWHITFDTAPQQALKVQLTVTTDGRITEARRFFSENIVGHTAAVEAFEVGEDGKSLTFDAALTNHRGEVRFRTVPPDASISVELATEPPDVPLVIGREQIARTGAVRLEVTDRRLHRRPHLSPKRYGIYIRARPDPRLTAASEELSDEAVEQLRELGYVD